METVAERARRAQEDLEFVRSAAARDASSAMPLPIAALWAVISLAGFALVDLAPERAALFWLVAAPLGFVASVWLGWRGARRAGELDRAGASRWVAHWGGLLIVIALSTLAVWSGETSWSGFGATLLLVAVAYGTAGIHLHRPLLWVAAILALGYPAVLYLERYAWTAVGAACAIALLATGLAGRGRGVA